MENNERNIASEVEAVLDEFVRPYLATHGGDLQVVGVEGGVVFFHLTGRCAGCAAADQTSEDLINRELTWQTASARSCSSRLWRFCANIPVSEFTMHTRAERKMLPSRQTARGAAARSASLEYRQEMNCRNWSYLRRMTQNEEFYVLCPDEDPFRQRDDQPSERTGGERERMIWR